MRSFGCIQTPAPADWGPPLPSDVVLKLPGCGEPSILLSETGEAGIEGATDHPILFTNNLRKAEEFLRSRGVVTGPVQVGGTEFFEVVDPEGNSLEICKEP